MRMFKVSFKVKKDNELSETMYQTLMADDLFEAGEIVQKSVEGEVLISSIIALNRVSVVKPA